MMNKIYEIPLGGYFDGINLISSTETNKLMAFFKSSSVISALRFLVNKLASISLSTLFTTHSICIYWSLNNLFDLTAALALS